MAPLERVTGTSTHRNRADAFALASACRCAANKISNKLNPDLHAQLVKGSATFTKTWPLSETGWTSDAILLAIGLFEVAFGLIAFCPHYVRLSALVFIGLMAGATAHHHQLNEVDPRNFTAVLTAASVLLFIVGAHTPKATKLAAAANKKKQ